ncbi:hypothetical protein ACFSQD_17670 [Flavihumibacter stibioxidans]|uniref:CPBP family intramembrane metalloprotease n=1 Tax=Flavihumibacter stibioxidans TaxID=1834163 RepID=A0ABR7MCI0_9BACT|nr:hypothetical protein [Flavihumibacter stibioxidans]MBC6492747.1 hypothetical protein [Flavihumibacter stibioxidans]
MEIRYVNKDFRNSLYCYLSLSLFFILAWWYGVVLEKKGFDVRQVEIDGVLLYIAGIFLIMLQQKIKIPDLLNRKIGADHRALYPFALGILFGLTDLLVFKIVLHPQPYDTLPPFLQPFPYSVLLYIQGAIYTEILYRLLPFTILLLVLEFFHPSGATRRVGFWIIAILTSLLEPVMQLPDGAIWLKAYSFLSGFAFNLLQAWFLRKAGFLAALNVRLGHYLVWHVLLGVYVEYFELR